MMQMPSGKEVGPKIPKEKGIRKETEKGWNEKERETGGGHQQDHILLGVETKKGKEIVTERGREIGTVIDSSVLLMAGTFFVTTSIRPIGT
jgi:hypothetical protein